MNQQGPKATIVSLFFVAGLAAYGVAQQRAGKCPPDVVDLKAPAYRIGLAAHGTKKNCELFLYISVEPRHFFREDMLALAERLNNDFCYESQLTVIFLDDYYAARHPIRHGARRMVQPDLQRDCRGGRKQRDRRRGWRERLAEP